jgi:hypothetical protein
MPSKVPALGLSGAPAQELAQPARPAARLARPERSTFSVAQTLTARLVPQLEPRVRVTPKVTQRRQKKHLAEAAQEACLQRH